VRIYLTGRLMIETESGLLDEEDLPARQGRIAFAYLVLNRRRPVPRLELGTALWGDSPPEAWEASLSALLSRLRGLFRKLAIDADISALSGSMHLSLPGELWIDLDAARSALDEAEGLMRAGRAREAWPPALVALSILERGFLHGEEQLWIIRERERIHSQHLRALELLADITLTLGESASSAHFARMCSDLEPFRESAYEREMRALLQMGNRAEALRTYERLRQWLADELGTDPSPALQAAFLEALQG
jgi:SARP family transcriptional regulator, regulator of embCAB operon